MSEFTEGIGYNGQSAPVLSAPARSRFADGGRVTLPIYKSIPELSAGRVSRFWSRANKGEIGCWNWSGTINTYGYGVLKIAGVTFGAHRVSFTLAHGAIPDGLQIDHMCKNTACVNPYHLRAVTQAENNPNVAKTHCPRGHEYTADNLRLRTRSGRTGRECRECTRQQLREQWKRGARKHGPNNGHGRSF